MPHGEEKASGRWRADPPLNGAFAGPETLGRQRRNSMIKWALIFLVAALVLALLGFGGLAGAAMGIAKILFVVALVIALAMLLLGVTVYRKVT
jgi:uncharacterized membrane protein YtjA (UPF0391 family)